MTATSRALVLFAAFSFLILILLACVLSVPIITEIDMANEMFRICAECDSGRRTLALVPDRDLSLRIARFLTDTEAMPGERVQVQPSQLWDSRDEG